MAESGSAELLQKSRSSVSLYQLILLHILLTYRLTGHLSSSHPSLLRSRFPELAGLIDREASGDKHARNENVGISPIRLCVMFQWRVGVIDDLHYLCQLRV